MWSFLLLMTFLDIKLLREDSTKWWGAILVKALI